MKDTNRRIYLEVIDSRYSTIRKLQKCLWIHFDEFLHLNLHWIYIWHLSFLNSLPIILGHINAYPAISFFSWGEVNNINIKQHKTLTCFDSIEEEHIGSANSLCQLKCRYFLPLLQSVDATFPSWTKLLTDVKTHWHPWHQVACHWETENSVFEKRAQENMGKAQSEMESEKRNILLL